MNHLTLREKIEIIRLTGENVPYRDVARIFNARHEERHVSFTTVARINKLFGETGKIFTEFFFEKNT